MTDQTDTIESTRLAALEKLRVPFPPEMIGKLPRVTCKDCSDRSKNCTKHQKTKCNTCKAFISTSHIHLDFVGHAELTDRLLSVDPEWNWEPVAFDDRGLPAITEAFTDDKMPGYRMWIRLTIRGVTRLGVGSVEKGIAAFDIEKQLIGDALRNAAMRFGVALDLWAKSDLASMHADNNADSPDDDSAGTKTTTRRAPNRSKPQETNSQDPGSRALAEDDDVATMSARALSEALGAAGLEQGGTVPQMRLRLQEARSGVAAAKVEAPADPNASSEKQRGMIRGLFGDTDRSVRLMRYEEIIGREVESTKDLTKKEASTIIETLLAEQPRE